ncbi:MAG: GNAT family N-acetyltransferase [Streptosporangiaceae bacterium]
MAWTLTSNLDEFLSAVSEHLRAEPVLNTVFLTVAETLKLGGTSAFGDAAPMFGWHQAPGAAVDGAFLQTPPFPVLMGMLPPGSADPLFRLLTAGGRQPAGANVHGADEATVSSAWAAVTGGTTSVHHRMRLFQLGRLTPPEPFPPGLARLADQDDFDLLVSWHVAFGAETASIAAENAHRTVADRLSHHGLMLWEVDREPVAMAGLTRGVAGVVRVAGVHTAPGHRQRGYGGAITTAVSQAALDGGATAVVLFTDLANPTSNALYQRLGYRPVGDRVLLEFWPPGTAEPDVTDPRAASFSAA